MVTVAERLSEAMAAQRVSQSALARAVGATQGSISLILLGKTTNSRLLPKIATFLGVSLAWLLGMADEQGDDGVVPVVPPQVMLPVVLPSENALAEMFEGLLLVIDELRPVRERQLDEIARELAQLLPSGLSALQGPLTTLRKAVEVRPRVLASDPRGPQQ